MRTITLLICAILLTGCTINQRKMVARSGATYGTVKVLKQMKVSAEKADKIKELAELALSSDKEKVKEALVGLIKGGDFNEEEQIILLSFLDDLSQSLVDLSNHDGELIILIKATAEGVILGIEIYKRSLTGDVLIYRSFA